MMIDLERRLAVLALVALSAACAAGGRAPDNAGTSGPAAPEPRTVQPGAPGDATRPVDLDQATRQQPGHSPADVRFMQGMIPHHAQALVMTALVRENTDNPELRALALRMDISQRDEIALMEGWLRAHGEAVEGPMGDMADMMRKGARMPGMLTSEQIAELRAARGAEFDRLFLEYMIMHHEGAVTMVNTLFATPGGGQESEIFQFASHVEADQTAEIQRMRRMLGGGSRAQLSQPEERGQR